MKTTITQVGAGGAGEASLIAVQAFSDAEALTAVRSGSGSLLLIGWHTSGDIVRGADSDHQAGEVHGIALNILGNRRAVTAVRTGAGSLELISWDVPRGLASIARLKDSQNKAGEASLIEAATLDASTLVTAVRAGNGKLKLISWRLEEDGGFTRLGDSGDQAGDVDLVAVATLGSPSRIVVTAVRTASGTLKMIGWNVPPQGRIERFPRDREFENGAVGEIAMVRRRDVADGVFPQPGVVTAVRNGAGDLAIGAWGVSPSGFELVGDSTGQAGEARAIAIAAAGPPSTYVASMRNGSDDLQLIAFEIGRNGGLTRTGERVRVGAKVSETAIVGLPDGRALTATRTRNVLSLETWSVSEALPLAPHLGESPMVTG